MAVAGHGATGIVSLALSSEKKSSQLYDDYNDDAYELQQRRCCRRCGELERGHWKTEDARKH
jgi:hypothetical protein